MTMFGSYPASLLGISRRVPLYDRGESEQDTFLVVAHGRCVRSR